MTVAVVLDQGRLKTLKYRHPWIFSGGVVGFTEPREPEAGALVPVFDEAGELLAHAFYNPVSQIALRILTWGSEPPPEDWLETRLKAAIARRRRLQETEGTNSYRLVHAESDGLPGLIVDRFGNVLVIQLSSKAMEIRRDAIIAYLQKECSPQAIVLRCDEDIRKKEGLELAEGLLAGELPVGGQVIQESGIQYRVDLLTGHKTGFYVDQRENRLAARPYLQGEVLDAFCYSGAFSLHALAAGASQLTQVDASQPVLEMARANLELNGHEVSAVEQIEANCFEQLRKFRDSRRQFDAVILDPPKLAPSRQHLGKAKRAYKDLNLLAIKLVRSGGSVVTFSCSGAMSPVDLQEVLFHATMDSGRKVQIVERLGAGSDHPVDLCFPESDYLCGFILQVL